MLSRHGVDIPRQTLALWVIQCGEYLQPLLNLMRGRLLESRVIHCDETRVEVLKESGRKPGSQSWMRVQTGGSPVKPVILIDYSIRRAQAVPAHLFAGWHRAFGVLGSCTAQILLKRRNFNPKAGRDVRI